MGAAEDGRALCRCDRAEVAHVLAEVGLDFGAGDLGRTDWKL